MLLDPTFDIPCPNPACQGTLKVTRVHLSAGSIKCETCEATVNLEGDARKIAESLDGLERAMKRLGFKK